MILTELSEELALFGLDPAELEDGFDLRLAGIIDSLGFLELVTALEADLGTELDLGDLPPEELTVLGPLARAIAAQVARSRASAPS